LYELHEKIHLLNYFIDMKLLSIVLRSAKKKLKDFYKFYRIKELIYPTKLANIKGKTSDLTPLGPE